MGSLAIFPIPNPPCNPLPHTYLVVGRLFIRLLNDEGMQLNGDTNKQLMSSAGKQYPIIGRTELVVEPGGGRNGC
jgi:hypothetical protein